MTHSREIDYVEGQPTPGLLRLQQTQSEILRQVAKFCAAHEINFFLTAGSALGATRHSDFIPWDDDLDIGMLREDYDRFAAAFNSDGPPGLVFQDDSTDADYFLGFGKVRLLGTYVSEPINKGMNFAQGIYIDVFPYDFVPKSAAERAVQISLLSLLSLIMLSVEPESVSAVRSFQILRTAVSKVRPMLPIEFAKRARRHASVWSLARKDGWLASYEMLGIRHWRRTRVRLDNLLPTQVGKFGSLTVPLPADVDQFLRSLYGEYNVLPSPEEQRPRHTSFVNFESESSDEVSAR